MSSPFIFLHKRHRALNNKTDHRDRKLSSNLGQVDDGRPILPTSHDSEYAGDDEDDEEELEEESEEESEEQPKPATKRVKTK